MQQHMPLHIIMQGMPIAIMLFIMSQQSFIFAMSPSMGMHFIIMPSLPISQVILHIMGIIIGIMFIIGIMPFIIGFMPFIIIGFIMPFIICGIMPFIIIGFIMPFIGIMPFIICGIMLGIICGIIPPIMFIWGMFGCMFIAGIIVGTPVAVGGKEEAGSAVYDRSAKCATTLKNKTTSRKIIRFDRARLV